MERPNSLFRWNCSFCSFSLRLPSPLWSFHNLEPSKFKGCRLALRRCVEARCQDVECLSTLSVWCLVIAFSDCIIVSCYSDIHMSFSFLHLFMAQHPSFKFVKCKHLLSQTLPVLQYADKKWSRIRGIARHKVCMVPSISLLFEQNPPVPT